MDVYLAERIGLSRGAYILFALLSGNDVAIQGIPGFGHTICYALCLSGLGDTLADDWVNIVNSPYHTTEYFHALKLDICNELKSNSKGYLRSRMPQLAKSFEQSDFPSVVALQAFLSPASAWSPHTRLPLPRIHSLDLIAQFCKEYIGWNGDQTLALKLHSLWPGVVIRMLCSVRI